MLRFSLDITDQGFIVIVNDKGFQIVYPADIWNPFPFKRAFASEFLYILTYTVPLLARAKEVYYDMPRPLFYSKYDQWFLEELPWLSNAYWSDSVWLFTRRLKNLKRHFREETHSPFALGKFKTENGAALALSLGGDSLASYVIGKKMGLEMVGVYYSDPLMASTDSLFFSFFDQLAREQNFRTHVFQDQVCKVCDYEVWQPFPSEIGGGLEILRYLMMMVPYAYHSQKKYLLLGNEYDLNLETRYKKWGKVAHKQPLQTWKKTLELDQWMQFLTGGTLRVTSLVHSLHRLGVYNIILSKAPEIGQCLVSCGDLFDGQGAHRWCYDCDSCADAYLFVNAFSQDAAEFKFEKSMFEKSKREFYPLLVRRQGPKDPYLFQESEQQRLAFLYTTRRGAQGWAVDEFRKKYLVETEKREQELTKTYLRPTPLKNDLPLSDLSSETALGLLKDFKTISSSHCG